MTAVLMARLFATAFFGFVVFGVLCMAVKENDNEVWAGFFAILVMACMGLGIFSAFGFIWMVGT